MNTIEIIVHCWNGHLDIYGHLLRAQGLSLLNLSAHDFPVHWTICYHPGDRLVMDVVDELREPLIQKKVVINELRLNEPQLFQRAIGRNLAALASCADCVWFSDCDYLFAGACLSQAIQATKDNPESIVYPQQISVTSHRVGDAFVSSMRAKEAFSEINLSTFYSRTERKAIGGIQIVNGDLARLKGYLNGTEWSRPVKNVAKGYRRMNCDVKYRGAINSTVAVQMCGVHRIRHSVYSVENEVKQGRE